MVMYKKEGKKTRKIDEDYLVLVDDKKWMDGMG